MVEFKLREHRKYLHPYWEGKMPSVDDMRKKTLENNWEFPELNLRAIDVSSMDLSDYDMQDVAFGEGTKWPIDPSKCPRGYNRLKEILEFGKNPGLGIRALHEKGIDGTGLSMAIIDQRLSEHNEYRDNLVHYEEFGYDDLCSPSEMHASAVASIAVGRNCGVAPKAKLYYFAANNKKEKDAQEIRTADYKIQALKRIMKINESLPDKEKIQVVSMSAGWMGSPKTEKSDEWYMVLEKAKKTGLFVLTTASFREYGLHFNGLGKKADGNPEMLSSYSDFEGYYGMPTEIKKESVLTHKGGEAWESEKKKFLSTISVPMDHRTVASPTGKDVYVHYFQGGLSWATPWLAGMFVLARQVNPGITPEHFWKIALKTGVLNEKTQGSIIQPQKLIEGLELEKSRVMKKIMQNGQKHAIHKKRKQNLTIIKKGEENAK